MKCGLGELGAYCRLCTCLSVCMYVYVVVYSAVDKDRGLGRAPRREQHMSRHEMVRWQEETTPGRDCG